VTDSSDDGSQEGGLGPAGPEDPRPAEPTAPSPDEFLEDYEVSSPAEEYENVDSGLVAGFWKVVLMLKFSLIGLTVGSLFALAEADLRRGGLLLAGGLVLFGLTVWEAKRLKARADAGEFEHELAEERDDQEQTHSATEQAKQ